MQYGNLVFPTATGRKRNFYEKFFFIIYFKNVFYKTIKQMKNTILRLTFHPQIEFIPKWKFEKSKKKIFHNEIKTFSFFISFVCFKIFFTHKQKTR